MVRKMRYDDIPVITRMIEIYNVEVAHFHYTLDYNMITAHLCACLIEDSLVCYVSVDDDDNIRGFIIINVTTPFFSRDRTTNNMMVYILPQYRQDKDFLFLFRKLIETAKEKKSLYIECTNSSGIKLGKFEEVMRKIGFIDYGSNLKMEVCYERCF